MPPAWFEPVTSASDRPQTLALDRLATGIGNSISIVILLLAADNEHFNM